MSGTAIKFCMSDATWASSRWCGYLTVDLQEEERAFHHQNPRNTWPDHMVFKLSISSNFNTKNLRKTLNLCFQSPQNKVCG